MHKAKQSNPLILASSSPYRRQLLRRFGLPFEALSPVVDESRLDNETAETLVERLAREKAMCLVNHHPDAVIIGSDQVAVLEDRILTKPGNHAQALMQLEKQSGNVVQFLTALCVVNAKKGQQQSDIILTEARFRSLNSIEIERYLAAEKPYDCAGSFKSEGLGICLLQTINGDDPTALIGLPLIRLAAMLRAEGYTVP